MGSVTIRNSLTSRGIQGMSPWNVSAESYTIGQIILGNNFIAKIEIASCLNCFNYGTYSWWYDSPYATQKYNPKVYMGAIQSVSQGWNYDRDYSRKNLPVGPEKSGSWLNSLQVNK